MHSEARLDQRTRRSVGPTDSYRSNLFLVSSGALGPHAFPAHDPFSGSSCIMLLAHNAPLRNLYPHNALPAHMYACARPHRHASCACIRGTFVLATCAAKWCTVPVARVCGAGTITSMRHEAPPDACAQSLLDPTHRLDGRGAYAPGPIARKVDEQLP